MSYSVLIVEDEPVLARNIQLYLDREGISAQTAGSAEEAWERLEQARPDVVVLDHNLPGRDGLSTLKALRERDPQLPVVMTTGHGSEQVAVEAMKAGAFDYLVKPVSLAQLKQVLDRAMQQQRQLQELAHLRRAGAPGGPSGGPWTLLRSMGESAPMQALRDRLRQIVDADLRLQGDVPAGRIDPGGDRHRQGTGGARTCTSKGPRRGGPLRRTQLRQPALDAGGERAVRPRARVPSPTPRSGASA